jgi:hypothetical protein
VPAHRVRLGAVLALAAVAWLGTSCAADAAPTGSATAPAPASAGAGATDGAASPDAVPVTSGVGDLPPDQVGRAHQAALGLIALGTIGAEKGGTDAVRALGEQVTADGRAVDERIRTLADGAGIVLADDLGAPGQALLADVGARTGPTFDQGWLRAVLDLEGQARGAADAVLASGASEEAKAAARAAITRLDALAAALHATSAGGGADTPTVVDAGSGGQAAERASVVPLALVGAGVLPTESAAHTRPGVVPVAVELPDRGVSAPVVPTATDADGALAVPDLPMVGWWAPGALPGAIGGTAVLAGHVDAPGGLGAFAALREVVVGERVLLHGADGRVVSYRATARRQLGKAALPAELFRAGGPPRLVLITCGGRFDRATRHYTDNVIVYADRA